MPRAPPGSSMVRVSRRDVVTAGIGASLILAPRSALAASGAFPAKNIQFIIPYAPGGGFDSYVRFISPLIEQHLLGRVSIVPVNITAGRGPRGIRQLYPSKPDGYTIGIFDLPGMFIQQALQGNNAYD